MIRESYRRILNENSAEDIAEYRAAKANAEKANARSRASYDYSIGKAKINDDYEVEIYGKKFIISMNASSFYASHQEVLNIFDEDGEIIIKIGNVYDSSFKYLPAAFALYFLTGTTVNYRTDNLWEELSSFIKKGGKEALITTSEVFASFAEKYDELGRFFAGSIETHGKNFNKRKDITRAYDHRQIYGKGRAALDRVGDTYVKARRSIYDEAPAIEAGSTVLYLGASGNQRAEVLSIDGEKAKIKTERGATLNVPLNKIEKVDVDYSVLEGE